MLPELLLAMTLAASPSPAALLHGWDQRRAEAWARADPVALRGLYTRGSEVGRTDVAMLREWRARGMRVEGLEVQLLTVEEVRRAPRRLVLAVTDRVAGGTASPGGLTLPNDRATSHTVVLRRLGGQWRVAAVRPGRS